MLHVHSKAKGTKDDFLHSSLAGLRSFNLMLLKRSANWGIRMRILGKVAPRSLYRAFTALAPLPGWIRHIEDPSVSKAARRVIKDHVFPTMNRLLRQALRARTQKATNDLISPLPNSFDALVAELVPLNSPLLKELLDTFFRRIRYGDKKMYLLQNWFELLFRYRLLDDSDRPSKKHRVVIARLASHRHECHGCFENFLGKIALKDSPSRAELRRWLREDLKRALVHEHGSPLVGVMIQTLERFPHGPLLSRMMHMRKLDFGYRLNLAWRALFAQDKAAGREVVRSFHVALLGRPRKDVHRRDHPRSALSRRLQWLEAYRSGKPRTRPGSLPESPAAWRKWGENHRDPIVRVAFARTPSDLVKNLSHADDNVRFLAPVATIRLPFVERNKLLAPGLADKRASVRAMTALALSQGVKQRREVDQLAPLLQKLHQDDDWTVRLIAFDRLAALGRPALLEPFVNDTAPMTVRSWSEVMAKWPTKTLVQWLDRKDHGAGLVLRTLYGRYRGNKPVWKKPDWARLGRLAKRSDSWIRLRLLSWFRHDSGGAIDWTPLFTDPSVVVRYHAITHLLEHGPGRPHLQRYAPQAIGLLRDRNLTVIAKAARALGALKHRPALPHLRALITHPACPVRNAAVVAIGAIDGKEGKPIECLTTALWTY